MPLIKLDKTMKEVMLNLHQDLFINNFSVHDEIVNIMDRFLHQPLALQMVRIIELQKVFNQVGYPYITFKFDVEYDKWGSYTATSSLNPYTYHLEIMKWQLLENGFKENQEEPHKDNPATNIANNATECKEDKEKTQEDISSDIDKEETHQQTKPITKEIIINSYDEFIKLLPKLQSLEKGKDTLILVLPDKSRFKRELIDINPL